ncbi:hypothetical protein ACFO4U_07005 [Exiguobacterium profundum]|jgi:membrane-associated HD superfamily phosphohydrolase|uniref:Uncharacterized protein n=1 Tax=Exiguobacterium sp. (strain ATCC BAA-1283 / AT1b) TaxID=360911 RepID=C4L5J6_EXISA|nr:MULTISPECIES: hypothetical protein [Exiguobacterium]QLQ21451.1 MAG: hypothetical protein HZT42_02985 [Paracoccaceae bacterium]QPI68513.1 hypothetical protein IR194_04270 [Exiguobacterium sp. PBE]ACQ69811.1 hypothetical protein EAT1b_0882 [Exiguobacterium sp. AT1b]MBG0917640.1 hypothetical protein [Exiguobacterium sp. SRB7LM]MCT4798043.1 hypothetical protein [Exiguobacterium profundum]
MEGLFGIVILFALVIGIGSLVYIIKSLIDMWKEYAATKNETILLLFILNIIGFFLSGALISMIVAIIFYWNRSKSMRLLGIILLIAGPVLFIVFAISAFTLFDTQMMDWQQMEYEMNL